MEKNLEETTDVAQAALKEKNKVKDITATEAEKAIRELREYWANREIEPNYAGSEPRCDAAAFTRNYYTDSAWE